MRKMGLASLYKEALKNSQAELERRSAMEALLQFDNLDLTLGELMVDLKKDWRIFSQLPLSDVLEALGGNQPKRRGRKPAQKRGRGRPAAPRSTSTSKRAPRRLTKAVTAKYSESIKAFLADHPDSKTKTIATEVGLTSKQAASLLKKLRANRLVTATGKAAGMRYTLKGSDAKKPALRKKTAKKIAAKKKTANKKTAKKKAPKKRTTKKRVAKK